ncbi:MAG: hypothetical protein ACRBBW_02330 [Cellvibrionaceae bacterium]
MSSTSIIALIVVLLVALLAYAFVSQTMERKRKQRQRMLAALKLRTKDFKYMLSGFPPDFLSKDLNALVHRCLIEVLEQLVGLEPSNKAYVDELALFSKQFEEAKRKPKKEARTKLTNPQQVKEVKSMLQSLHNFIGLQQKRGNLSAAQFKQYESQIKQLVVQITVDSYILNAKQAQGSNKARLAVHYYTLAKKLLLKESGNASYQKQVQQLATVIDELEAELTAQEPEYEADKDAEAAREQASSEWDEFNKDPEDPWKKKSVYD